jgi:hypothetical protein
MLSIPHGLDNWLTDGGKVVSLTRRQPRYSPETLLPSSGTHFCQRLSKPQGLVRPEGLGKLITIFHLIGSRTRDLPTCSIAPQVIQ